MDYAVIVSAIVLGLSVLATGAKFLDWFLHSNPQTMARTIRWMAILLAIAAIPLIALLIVRDQWAGAMLLGAAALILPTVLKWPAVLSNVRTAFGQFRSRPRPFEMPPVWDPDSATDPNTVQRAAVILEAYVKQQAALSAPDAGGNGAGMTAKEALEVLGLPDGADVAAVHTAHRRLMRMADPDVGGSPYLAAKIDQARDRLIDALRRRSGPTAVGSEPKRLPKR